MVTGEGLVDATSFTGKVVGRVLERAQTAGIDALVVAGDVAPGSRIDALSLVARYGPERALAEPAECLMELVETALAAGAKRTLSCSRKCRSQSPTHRISPTARASTACARSPSRPSSSTTRRIDWLPGGFLGVDLFFVLSGYLITSLLLVEWEARNRIDLRRFWLRRARRLLPALVVVVLASLALAAIFARQDLAHTRSDAVSSLLYYTNWHEIAANHSYFNLMGNPSLLQHTWSLAIEEQFYIVWPLLLVPCLVLVGRKRLPMLVIAGIAASVALMWILYNPNADPSRVYYGTDTRAFLLLMGILLALVWPWIERLRQAVPLLELLGVSALVGTVLLFLRMQDFNPTLFRGGDLAAAFCFAVLVAAVAHPRDGHRRGARRRSAALGRRAQLRDLSLALADHRARRGRERADERRRRGCGGGPRPRGRRAFVQVRRAADPDGEPATAARQAPAPLPARGRRARGRWASPWPSRSCS